jgi:hypothetical protein
VIADPELDQGYLATQEMIDHAKQAGYLDRLHGQTVMKISTRFD